MRSDFDIWDVSRAMISFGNLGQIIEAFGTLNDKSKFPEIEIVNYWNRFPEKPSVRWKDLMFHIVFLDDEFAMETNDPSNRFDLRNSIFIVDTHNDKEKFGWTRCLFQVSMR